MSRQCKNDTAVSAKISSRLHYEYKKILKKKREKEKNKVFFSTTECRIADFVAIALMSTNICMSQDMQTRKYSKILENHVLFFKSFPRVKNIFQK